MKTSLSGQSLIKSFESCRLKAYRDSIGVWTIGWGSTWYEDGTRVQQGDQITQERADALFRLVLAEFEIGVERLLKVKLTQHQFDALVSFAYNVGLGNLQRSTLLRKVNANPKDPAIAAEFAKWNRAGGKVLNGLTRRRKAEADLYFL